MRGEKRGYGLRAAGCGAVMIAVIACLVSACGARPPTTVVARDAHATATDTTSAGEITIDGDSDDDADDASDAIEPNAAEECPRNMVVVVSNTNARRYCVDKYEASLVEMLPDGTERPFAHFTAVDGHDVRAVSQPGVFPQGFISEVQAEDACSASGKRLCTHEEWKTACMGPSRTTFPYGDARRPGTCHDTGKSAALAVFGAKALAASTPVVAPHASASPVARASAPSAKNASNTGNTSHAKTGKRAHNTKGRAASTVKTRATASAKTGPTATKRAAPTKSSAAKKETHARRTGKVSTRPAAVEASVWTRLNDPALGQVEGALAKTGEHDQCVNGFGVYDMVGNIHEWVATDRSSPHGTFAGGYYLDTALNGDGCNYKTQAHAHEYHDYSTGFRCCADAAASPAAPPAP